MSKLREAARDKSCKVRVPGICSMEKDKTVGAHLNGAGLGVKHHDIFIADACHECHAWLDGGYAKYVNRAERDLIHMEAIIRTQNARLKEDLIKVAE